MKSRSKIGFHKMTCKYYANDMVDICNQSVIYTGYVYLIIENTCQEKNIPIFTSYILMYVQMLCPYIVHVYA